MPVYSGNFRHSNSGSYRVAASGTGVVLPGVGWDDLNGGHETYQHNSVNSLACYLPHLENNSARARLQQAISHLEATRKYDARVSQIYLLLGRTDCLNEHSKAKKNNPSAVPVCTQFKNGQMESLSEIS